MERVMLRAGGERIFCTGLLSAPAYSLAISPDWVASASEGSSLGELVQLGGGGSVRWELLIAESDCDCVALSILFPLIPFCSV